jgi:Inner membrane protein YgaP-like, transmembrane domain
VAEDWARQTHEHRYETMKRQRIIYLVAGTLVLTGLALGYWVNQLWLFLAAFVGLNLFQTAFTGFCPLERILIKLGIGRAGEECGAAPR